MAIIIAFSLSCKQENLEDCRLCEELLTDFNGQSIGLSSIGLQCDKDEIEEKSKMHMKSNGVYATWICEQ